MKTRHALLIVLFTLAAILLSSCAPHPGIYLTKTASPTTFNQAGDVITYTYVISNVGDTSLSNVQLSDNGNPVTCPATGVMQYSPMTCTMQYTITAADMLAGQVDTTATAVGYGAGDCCSGCTGSHNTRVSSSAHALVTLNAEAQTGLLLVKTADVASFSQVGQIISYTYTVTNTGEANLTEAITVEDDRATVNCPALPAGGLAPGASLECKAAYTVTEEDLVSGKITNTATAHSGELPSNPVTLEIPINAQASLMLEKDASPASYSYAGDVITYSLKITNTGNVPLAGPLVINDAKLSTWVCSVSPVEQLLPGAEMTCTASLTISEGAVGYSLRNTATVSLMYGDQVVTSNESMVTVYPVPTQVPTVNCSQYNYLPYECMMNGCHPDSYTMICYP